MYTAEFVASAPTPIADQSRTSYRWYNDSVGNYNVPPAGSPRARNTLSMLLFIGASHTNLARTLRRNSQYVEYSSHIYEKNA